MFVDTGQDITIVYGLINPADSVHYVRIQKAILTKNDIVRLASLEENNIYTDSLTVEVYVTDHYNQPISGMHWFLEKTYIHKTDTSGDFNWDDDYPVFYFSGNLDHDFISDKWICLKITNQETGKEIYGKADVVNDFTILLPNEDDPVLDISYTAENSSFMLLQTLYGKRYEVSIYFSYDEYHATHYPYGEPTTHTVHWDHATKVYPDYPDHESGTKLYLNYHPSAFYSWIRDAIPKNDSVVRIARFFNMDFWSCTTEMHTYMFLCENGFLGDVPIYTNLTSNSGTNDVYGLFTTRFKKPVIKQVSSLTSYKIATNCDRNFVTTLNK